MSLAASRGDASRSLDTAPRAGHRARMLDVWALLFQLVLPLVALWAASSVVTALAFEHVAGGGADDDDRIGLEAWLLFAAAGAAFGGLFGTMLVLRDLVLSREAVGEVTMLLLFVAPATLLGATFSCLLASAVMRAWRG